MSKLKPIRICSSCKEQSQPTASSRWPIRSLCWSCAKRKAGRVAVNVAAGSLLVIAGFIIDRRMQRPEVHFIGKPAPDHAAPGDSVGAGAASGQAGHASLGGEPTPGSDTGVGASAPPAPASLQPHVAIVKPPGTPADICGAPTKSGKPCQRKVKDGGYCWQHKYLAEPKSSPASG
jgi:hypothetical protein